MNTDCEYGDWGKKFDDFCKNWNFLVGEWNLKRLDHRNSIVESP